MDGTAALAAPAPAGSDKRTQAALFGVVCAGTEEIAIPGAILREALAAPLALNPHAGLPAHALGSFNLRGAPVPAVDLRRLLGVPAQGPFSHMVILGTRMGRLGLAVDGIHDMLRAPLTHVHPLIAVPGARPHPLASEVLMAPDSDKVRLILDEAALLARPDIAWGGQAIAPAVSGVRRLHVLHARLNGQRLALPIEAVREIVPSPKIEPFQVETRLFRGLMRLREARIPVLDLAALLHWPADPTPCTQVLVLRGPHGALAVPVHEVLALALHDQEAMTSLPGIGLPRRDLLRGGLETADGRSLLLAHAALLNSEEVAGMSRLHEGLAASTGQGPKAAQEAGWQPAELLGFTAAGNEYVLRLAEVREILQLPASLLQLQTDWVHGLLPYHGALVPLVALRALLGAGPALADSRVLLVQHGARCTGFLVDATSAIRHVALPALAAGPPPPPGTPPALLLRAAIRNLPGRERGRSVALALLDLPRLAAWLDPAPV